MDSVTLSELRKPRTYPAVSVLMPTDRRAPGNRAAGGRRAGATGVNKVSAFSAAAIKRVSVLGDRPNQIVYTLAEQSKRKRGTAVLGLLLGAFSLALVALLAIVTMYFVGAEQGATSLLNGNAVHEWVHDSRHLLGFPCH